MTAEFNKVLIYILHVIPLKLFLSVINIKKKDSLIWWFEINLYSASHKMKWYLLCEDNGSQL